MQIAAHNAALGRSSAKAQKTSAPPTPKSPSGGGGHSRKSSISSPTSPTSPNRVAARTYAAAASYYQQQPGYPYLSPSTAYPYLPGLNATAFPTLQSVYGTGAGGLGQPFQYTTGGKLTLMRSGSLSSASPVVGTSAVTAVGGTSPHDEEALVDEEGDTNMEG